MSIARAFTTRRVKQSLTLSESDVLPHRSNTTKATGSIRHKISAPVELIYTTNMIAYNAPDIPRTASSTSSSHRSDDDSDARTAASTPPTSPDTESPSLSPEPNHLSCYFTVPGQAAAAASPAPQSEPPVIPLRAASHSKKSYDSLVRQRSSSRMSEQSQRTLASKASFSFSRSSSSSTSTSISSVPPQNKTKAPIVSAASPSQHIAISGPPSTQVSHRKEFSQAQHPFGPELAQVTEIAEEYGVKEQLNEASAEEQVLAAKGLAKFSADDYLNEIQGIFTNFFGETKPMATAMWI
ncbi:hypothetical protein B0T16DRAFT_384840 [Cercophora newfieldiana]|uniref:Uncharacterized protein n=1 Tax=Cercophora newfieldiana TaxID=92897 RepID=A0AA39YNZ9_9PEZI|nr:hypothetical protein B0T16DRAFT_384840 [Cercophora newfieldiana]